MTEPVVYSLKHWISN